MATWCRSCCSKVPVGVIRELQGLALWRNQPRAATDGPLAVLATGGAVLVKFQFSNYRYNFDSASFIFFCGPSCSLGMCPPADEPG